MIHKKRPVVAPGEMEQIKTYERTAYEVSGSEDNYSKDRGGVEDGNSNNERTDMYRLSDGLPLTVTMEAGEVISVTGNTCKRGDVYARKEVTNPTRIVTSTVRVSGGDADMVSVKTKEDIPKGKIFECVKALKSVEVPAPVHIGDVLVKDVAGTGVDIVATKNVESI